jgi:XTP/dITP diphosphohydrolase
MALSSPHGNTECVAGECRGTITLTPQGDRGFGYDPVFMPDGYAQTFAEISIEEKNGMSHRGRALQAAVEAWGETFANLP